MEEKELFIEKKLEDGILTFILEGRLNTNTAPELETEVDAIPEVDELVFDLSKIEYLSSAGLRVLLFAKKKMGEKEMVVRNSSDEIREIFDVTGFSDILNIE